MVPFSFAGEEMALLDGGALYWPREKALLVADLHLEKASFYARFGQMLPPYDSRETLERVAVAIRASGARRVFTLGDNFHDGEGASRLEPHAAGMPAALTRVVDWVWIGGNHDAGAAPGTMLDELAIGALVLRHEAQPGEPKPELSGHFHPKLRIAARGRSVARPCWAASERKLILPAFGAFTGGLDVADPAIIAAMQPARAVHAVLPVRGQLVQVPVWREAPPVK